VKHLADLLLTSMVKQDPGILPLAARYAATENSVAGSLNMMTGWRTVTGVRTVGQYVVDLTRRTVFVTAALDEGGSSTMFWARITTDTDDRIAELEMYKAASRHQGGFVMHADELGKFPAGWTSAIPADGRATRDELELLARAIYDNTLPAPEASEDCLLMELGGVVYEDPDYMDLLMIGEIQPHESDEPVTMVAGLGDFRPTDPHARVLAVDEEQGIAVVTAAIPGFVSPYVVRKTTESCFVPAPMIEMHRRSLDTGWIDERKALIEMPAMCMSTQVVRLHSGKLQGLQLFNALTGPGATSPWPIDRDANAR